MNGVSQSVLVALAGRSSSTTPSALTSSTSSALHSRRSRGLVGAGPRSASGPRSSGRSTRSPAPLRSSATSVSTCWPPTSSGERCSPSRAPRPRAWSTALGSCSSTREWRRSTKTGSASLAGGSHRRARVDLPGPHRRSSFGSRPGRRTPPIRLCWTNRQGPSRERFRCTHVHDRVLVDVPRPSNRGGRRGGGGSMMSIRTRTAGCV